jgi:hypothetical protein
MEWRMKYRLGDDQSFDRSKYELMCGIAESLGQASGWGVMALKVTFSNRDIVLSLGVSSLPAGSGSVPLIR